MLKKIFTLILISIISVNCNNSKNIVTDSEYKALEKASNFSNGIKSNSLPKSPYQYVVLESLNNNYSRERMSELISILHNYRYDTSKKIAKIEDLLSSLNLNNKKKLNFQDSADLQIITYLFLEQVLFKAKNINTEKLIADNLRILFQYTKPLESRVISKALLYSKKELNNKEKIKIKNHLITLNKIGFNDLSLLNQKTKDRLKKESKEAVLLLK